MRLTALTTLSKPNHTNNSIKPGSQIRVLWMTLNSRYIWEAFSHFLPLGHVTHYPPQYVIPASCYLASSIHTRVKHLNNENSRTCHRTKENFSRVSHTCEHISHNSRLTRVNPHVRYNALHTCIPMPCVQLQSHALLYLHHAPSCACAQLTHIYTVMGKYITPLRLLSAIP